MRGVNLFRVVALWLALVSLPDEVRVCRGEEVNGPAEAETSRLRYEGPKLLTGAIYDQGSAGTKLLFRFQRRAKRSGQRLDIEREYTHPDGTLAARERVVYEGNALTLFEFHQAQTGERGLAAIRPPSGPGVPGSVSFEYSPEPGAKVKTGTEATMSDMVVNDMIGQFLIAHWDLLVRGEKVRCRYLVISRRETVGFTFTRTAESSWHGQRAIIVRMEATSKLLAPLIKPLSFTIEEAVPHRVFQYVGRTTPKIRDGNKWKDLDAVTVFDWEHAEP
jgi:hypothetical protein